MASDVCPWCTEPLLRNHPLRAPFAGARRWYQFTPGPTRACPRCGGRVVSTAAQSRWLLLPAGALVIVLLALLGVFGLPLLAQGLLLFVAAVGAYRAQAGARLVRDER
jgi:hypothetical protein